MGLIQRLRTSLPDPARRLLRPLYEFSRQWRTKYDSEFAYWVSEFEASGGRFPNNYYRTLLLAIAQERDDTFLDGRIVADFGCGPQGSLAWAQSARIRLGLDVLADRYFDRFGASMATHGMVYVRTTEQAIPLPSGSVDVMFTMNALDHVDDLDAMCREILRVLRPGGDLVGSFNLDEPPTLTEPQHLDERRLRVALLDRLEVRSCRYARRGPEHDLYANFAPGRELYVPGEPGFMWVRALKPTSG
jgi:SAM-dependent methyltransferase